MNKDLFLRDLRHFLSDMPTEEREQAIKYYEDYFEDAGAENEQQVIQELGSPVDIAKQIKSVNQDSIEYGQGNDFHNNQAYPNVYSNASNNNQNAYQQYNQTGNHFGYQNGFQNAAPKKKWTDDPGKIALVVILAILAIPVGIPILGVLFGILCSLFAVVFSLFIGFFAAGAGILFGGIACIVSSFFLIPAAGISSSIIVLGIGLILLSIGGFLIWVGVLFCCKLLPAVVRLIGKAGKGIGKGVHSFFC